MEAATEGGFIEFALDRGACTALVEAEDLVVEIEPVGDEGKTFDESPGALEIGLEVCVEVEVAVGAVVPPPLLPVGPNLSARPRPAVSLPLLRLPRLPPRPFPAGQPASRAGHSVARTNCCAPASSRTLSTAIRPVGRTIRHENPSGGSVRNH